MTPPVNTDMRATIPGAATQQQDSISTAAKQFETLFVQMLIQQMRQAQLENGFFGKGSGANIYEAMFTEHMAEQLVDRSPFGIAALLERQWSPDDAPAVAKAVADQAYRTALEALPQAAMQNLPNSTTALHSANSHAHPAPANDASGFGWRSDPIDGSRRFHQGVDLAAAQGAPVIAVAPAKVLFAGESPGYGKNVVLEHAEGWTSRYAHLSATAVEAGDLIPRGARLGQVGSTGRSTGPHLHFEVIHNGQHVDPQQAVSGSLRPQVLGGLADISNGTEGN